MENKTDYLLKLKANNPALVRDTWAALGSLTCSTNTKLYIPGNLYQVKIPDYENASIELPELYDAIIYCETAYKVDGENFPAIDWENATTIDVEGHCQIEAGITSPCFRVILNGEEYFKITTPVNTDYIPFNDDEAASDDVLIDDRELMTILLETGCPFIRVDELEYNRDIIKNLMIRPVLDFYYSYMPLIEEQAYGYVGQNKEFKVEFPIGAYSVVPYYTQGSGVGGSGVLGTPFAMYQEMAMSGTLGRGGGQFGRGVSYRKSVPGYVGGFGSGGSSLGAGLDNLATQQGMINRFKREKFTTIREDGKKYAFGYSSVGGNLCFKWLKVSYNWDDIPLDQMTIVRNLCTAKVLQGLGMLRTQVNADTPGKIDYSIFTNRAKELWDENAKLLMSNTGTLSLALMRGGLR